jgi:hypothetical protein
MPRKAASESLATGCIVALDGGTPGGGTTTADAAFPFAI